MFCDRLLNRFTVKEHSMKFAELVDIEELRELCKSYTGITGAVTALLELDGTVLVATGWQDICTRFHRVNPETAVRCRESDTVLAGRLKQVEAYNVYRCKNGLVDVAVPIKIRGEHVANFFTGQFFVEAPDTDYFSRQAEEFGFDGDAYLEALGRVPIFSENTIGFMMDFFTRLAQLIGEMGMARIELLESNDRLSNSRNMLSTIINSIPQSIFWKDRESVYLGCNRVFARQAHIDDLDGIAGKNDFDLPWSREESEGYRADDRDIMEKGRLKEHIVETQHQADGKVVWIDTTKIPLTDPSGAVIGVLGVYEDITERKRVEEEKAKLQAELQQAQKMESIGRLAGGVAHDFNNMLLVILAHAEIALQQIDASDRLHVNLTEISKAAKRSVDLTRQLLAYARKQTIAPKVLNLNESLKGTLNMLQHLIGEDIHLVRRPTASLWLVKMDPSQLDQILANLCLNARDAIADIGKITIETANVNVNMEAGDSSPHADILPGEYVRLTVSDNGSGMDKKTLTKIFEPYFTTKELGKGTGLGLATVYGIVRQNGGFVYVYSEPGSGTTFSIYLPRFEGDTATSQAGDFAGQSARGHETILLVEDEPAILAVTETVVRNLGYSVLSAHAPEEAIALAKGYGAEIDLLITDVVMPEMNGRDLAKNLTSRYPNLKCLFMSGYTANVIAHHGVLEDGVNFINKPFSSKDLATKIREALGKK
jgi:PAS domain S-box-containing protein